MSRCWLSILITLCSLSSVATAEAKNNRAAASPGAVLAASCSSCHGTHSDVETSIVTLSERTAAEIRAALLEFRNDDRAATLMNRIAKGYSEDEIAAIADYLGKP